jgi:hypothetical protein
MWLLSWSESRSLGYNQAWPLQKIWFGLGSSLSKTSCGLAWERRNVQISQIIIFIIFIIFWGADPACADPTLKDWPEASSSGQVWPGSGSVSV